jgi:hypothetical protein
VGRKGVITVKIKVIECVFVLFLITAAIMGPFVNGRHVENDAALASTMEAE